MPLFAGCSKKQPTNDGHVLPNTADILVSDHPSGSGLYLSSDGHFLEFLSRDQKTIFYDLRTYSRQESTNPLRPAVALIDPNPDPRIAVNRAKVQSLLGTHALMDNEFFITPDNIFIVFKKSSPGQKEFELQIMPPEPSLSLAIHRATGRRQTVTVGHFWPSPDGSHVLYTVEGEEKIQSGLQRYRDLFLMGDLKTPFGQNFRSQKIAEGVAEAAAWDKTNRKFWFVKPSVGIVERDLIAPTAEQIEKQLKKVDVTQKKLSDTPVLVGRIFYLARSQNTIFVSMFLEDQRMADIEIPRNQFPELEKTLQDADAGNTGDFKSLINRSIKIINAAEVRARRLNTSGMSAGAQKKADAFNATGRFSILLGSGTKITIE